MSFFGLGGGGLKVQIELHADPEAIISGEIVQLDHSPSWKIKRNIFSVLNQTPSFSRSKQEVQTKFNNYQDDNASVMSDITSHTLSPGVFASRDPYGNLSGGFGNKPEIASSDIIFAYSNNQRVDGVVHLFLPPGKSFEHLGIKLQFLGRIVMSNSLHEGRPHYDFISLVKELYPPGTLYQNTTSIPFQFGHMEMQNETYHGRNVAVKYFVRVIVERKFFPPIEKDKEIIVQRLGNEPKINEPIKMEVGIEECLHIEFEYEKRCYHLRDIIIGKINFLLVRIKIKYMELAVIRRESSGEGISHSKNQGGTSQNNNSDSNAQNVTETQTLTKYEIMDGAPVKGEIIPVRLSLAGIPADLTPTYNAVNNKFSVRYFLNLVLVDEEDRRYFKQQEIILWRKVLG